MTRSTRREWLAGVGGVALVAALGRARAQAHPHAQPSVGPGFGAVFVSPTLTPYVDELPIPAKRPLGGVIEIAQGMHQFHRELSPAPSWGYGGASHLGPTLLANRSERIKTTFVNRLPGHLFAPDIDLSHHGTSSEDLVRPPVSVHLHGAPNEPQYDGHPLHLFRPGESMDYVFNNELPATTLWLHDHAMGNTRLNVYAGLATQYWLRDRWDTGLPGNPLGLPVGDFEIPLIIQDKIFFESGGPRYYATPTVPQDNWQGGFCGDVMCVNGKAWPNLNVARGLYRFRLVNAAPLSDFSFHFSNGMTFYVIGSDGGLLDAPVRVTRLTVGVGERYDLLVDFSTLTPGEKVELLNDEEIVWPGQLLGSRRIPNVMRFSVQSVRGHPGPVPSVLRGPPGKPRALPTRLTPTSVRTVTLNILAESRLPFSDMNINNVGYLDEPVEQPRAGSVERWDIVNTNSMPHTLHIHLVQFRVLDRQDFDANAYLAQGLPAKGVRWAPPVDAFLGASAAEPALDIEAGWKDTVHCWPGQVTRIVVRFPTEEEVGFPLDQVFGTVRVEMHDHTMDVPLQGYTWHCHIMDHEDHEMMLRFRIAAP